MPELSRRLSAILSLIPEGARVADIGTDHAYLPIALAVSGRAKRVIACDIHKGPLAVARKNLAVSGAVGVELRLGDGLSPVAEGEVDTVVIAGMGGEVIASILGAADWVKSRRPLLLLQPMSSAEELRRFLSDGGFSIRSERAVEDAGRVYAVIAAVYTGERGAYSEPEEYIGHLRGRDAAERRYIAWQHRRLLKEAAELEHIPRRAQAYARAARCAAWIGRVRDAFGGAEEAGLSGDAVKTEDGFRQG
ncbi:MAG: tRNA (adenine(22)-N(1))-methyltransferase [Candidatus Howiella sp.]|jgi:tRNA (adenine22-N1)-methyltransferase